MFSQLKTTYQIASSLTFFNWTGAVGYTTGMDIKMYLFNVRYFQSEYF